MTDTAERTFIRIALPLPLDVAGTLLQLVGRAYPDTLIHQEGHREMVLSIDSRQRIDPATVDTAGLPLLADQDTADGTLVDMGPEGPSIGWPDAIAQVLAGACKDMLEAYPDAANYLESHFRDRTTQPSGTSSSSPAPPDRPRTRCASPRRPVSPSSKRRWPDAAREVLTSNNNRGVTPILTADHVAVFPRTGGIPLFIERRHIVRKYLTALFASLGGFALLSISALPALADDHELTYTDAGPVDMSTYGDESPTGNVGAHLAVGSLDLGPGEWTITASVRLFVPDVDGVWKNSQGCGLYSFDGQLGGAGGSSGIWTATAEGKEVVLDTFLVPPDWTDEPIVVTSETDFMVELVCFIDQSHSGAQPEQREGMAATDIAIHAVRTVEDDDSDDGDGDSDGDGTGDGDDTDTSTDTSDPEPVPTAIPAGAELPTTGVGTTAAFTVAALVMVAAGGILLLRRLTTR